MKLNLPFLVMALIIGAFVDFIFQGSWEARNKSLWGKGDNRLKSFAATCVHSIIYASLTTLAVLLILGMLEKAYTVFPVLFVSHALIDTRIPVRFIMRLKGIPWQSIVKGNLVYLEIGIDQRLHEAVILALAFFV